MDACEVDAEGGRRLGNACWSQQVASCLLLPPATYLMPLPILSGILTHIHTREFGDGVIYC
jgi:hypothetical protein